MSRRCLDLWSLLTARRAFDASDLGREAAEGVARLLRSRSPRSDPPLRFIHKSATDAVAQAMSSATDLPQTVRVAAIEALVRQPQRYVELTRSDAGDRRVGMAGVFADATQAYVVTAVGDLGQLGPATGFKSLTVHAVDIPDELDSISAAIVAEQLEVLARAALNADSSFHWEGGRPARALWCGLPSDSPARGDEVDALGKVAGLAITVSDPGRTDRLALGSSPELLVLLPAFASANDHVLADEFKGAGGELITVTEQSPGDAITAARLGIHDAVRAHLATAAQAVTPPRPITPRPALPTRIPDTRHASDQGRLRGFSRSEIDGALGDRWTRPALATPGSAPVPGSPLVIGMQHAAVGRPDDRDVLLCVTAGGRRLHLVVVRTDETSEPMTIITGWDPDAVENQGIWRPDGLRPTAEGVHRLPPTKWIVE